jgi:hypothetical protein
MSDEQSLQGRQELQERLELQGRQQQQLQTHRGRQLQLRQLRYKLQHVQL